MLSQKSSSKCIRTFIRCEHGYPLFSSNWQSQTHFPPFLLFSLIEPLVKCTLNTLPLAITLYLSSQISKGSPSSILAFRPLAVLSQLGVKISYGRLRQTSFRRKWNILSDRIVRQGFIKGSDIFSYKAFLSMIPNLLFSLRASITSKITETALMQLTAQGI